ncbi:MAG: hypothetical protein AAB632_01230 [Patescibacteria group bacterium]
MPTKWPSLEDALKEIQNNGFPEEPVAISNELIAELNEDQLNILGKLDELTTKGAELEKQIAARRPNASGVFNDGYAVTICEDEDDFIIITAGLRHELDGVVKETRKVLGDAIMNGLSHLGIIQRVSIQYGLISAEQ